jgi:hypothetical protein
MAERESGGRTREDYAPVREHVLDRFGFVWRVVRDGGMLTRADYAGTKSVGIDVAERDYGPLLGVYARVRVPGPPPVDFVRTEAVMEALPALVRARMEYLGLSYREVGRQAGVSFSTVHRFIEGGNDPSFRAARCLLRWLHLTSPKNAEEDSDRHAPCPDCTCCEAEDCEAFLCMDCPCHQPRENAEEDSDRHAPCPDCTCCEAEDCEAFLCMDCPCHQPRENADLCHNGHLFEPGQDADALDEAGDPRWCDVCGEARRATAEKAEPCCEHPAADHDQHGCTVDVSTNRRVYERCHVTPENADGGAHG